MGYGTKICALVLAAGYSSRMGCFKPLMKIGDKTPLEHIIWSFNNAGISDIRVIAGYKYNEIVDFLLHMDVEVIVNTSFIDGMFSSVKKGVSSICDEEAFFILPVDTPLIKPNTISEIVSFYKRSKKGIVYPVFNGKRGHPPLISAQYKNKILSYDSDNGLRGFLQKHISDSNELNVVDNGIIMGMNDTYEYSLLLDYYNNSYAPNADEYTGIYEKNIISKP